MPVRVRGGHDSFHGFFFWNSQKASQNRVQVRVSWVDFIFLKLQPRIWALEGTVGRYRERQAAIIHGLPIFNPIANITINYHLALCIVVTFYFDH